LKQRRLKQINMCSLFVLLNYKALTTYVLLGTLSLEAEEDGEWWLFT